MDRESQLIPLGPFAEIRGGNSAMQAFACVSTAMVASTLLQHTALRGSIESERLDRLDRVWYKNRYLDRVWYKKPHFSQAPTSINHNEIINRFHLEGHGVAPHLPLTATETQANTQDPGALRLPRMPFHPIALRLTRATNAHPLHPAALAFVSYGIVLVRDRVWRHKK